MARKPKIEIITTHGNCRHLLYPPGVKEITLDRGWCTCFGDDNMMIVSREEEVRCCRWSPRSAKVMKSEQNVAHEQRILLQAFRGKK